MGQSVVRQLHGAKTKRMEKTKVVVTLVNPRA